MSNPYDKLAAIIDGQHDPVLYDPENPYRGLAWLWNGDAFGPRREDIETSERADWYVVPGHPKTLLYVGHVAIRGRNVPVHLDDHSRAEDVATAQAYLANPDVAEAYAIVRDVLDKTANH